MTVLLLADVTRPLLSTSTLGISKVVSPSTVVFEDGPYEPAVTPLFLIVVLIVTSLVPSNTLDPVTSPDNAMVTGFANPLLPPSPEDVVGILIVWLDDDVSLPASSTV